MATDSEALLKRTSPRMIFRKSALLVLAIYFFFLYFPPPNASHQAPLSPPTVFREKSAEDMKFFIVAFSIGERMLFDKLPLKRLERALRFQFSDNPDLLRGVKIKYIWHKDGLVKIPYKRNNRLYIVRVSAIDNPNFSADSPPDRFTISIRKAFSPR